MCVCMGLSVCVCVFECLCVYVTIHDKTNHIVAKMIFELTDYTPNTYDIMIN